MTEKYFFLSTSNLRLQVPIGSSLSHCLPVYWFHVVYYTVVLLISLQIWSKALNYKICAFPDLNSRLSIASQALCLMSHSRGAHFFMLCSVYTVSEIVIEIDFYQIKKWTLKNTRNTLWKCKNPYSWLKITKLQSF